MSNERPESPLRAAKVLKELIKELASDYPSRDLKDFVRGLDRCVVCDQRVAPDCGYGCGIDLCCSRECRIEFEALPIDGPDRSFEYQVGDYE